MGDGPLPQRWALADGDGQMGRWGGARVVGDGCLLPSFLPPPAACSTAPAPTAWDLQTVSALRVYFGAILATSGGGSTATPSIALTKRGVVSRTRPAIGCVFAPVSP